ncbi:C-Jun-amino-terminal kinase-interacting protein 4-like isoform X14 [Mya arenaria]|uniref:C-Jun-amino-terminal kinase-interacting protein 4-like isoform X14 n=1 Tax=Mya arenaria TaxID=6604 RepID=UPI0022E90900|nr:C-Jun-amino-terminal kinase-interacting protein 4-like isoform X14 [Mya arenaria]
MATMMAEIVYGTKEEGHVMSEKVTQLASSVYSEFEKMIKKYDEDVVKELMPLVVGILESLDQAFTDKQEADVESELLKEDNEQLLTQYEREKQLRKSADQKFLETEDENEEYRKQTEEKIESLESIVRMMELKNKNATDHINRMDEKESEMKKEYNKVHERYTELMRTHMDYMERAKMLMGTDRIAEMANSPRTSIDKGSRRRSSSYGFVKSPQISPYEKGMFQLPNLKPVGSVNLTGNTPHRSGTGSPPDASAFDMMSPRSSNVSIKSELSDLESPDINSNTGRRVVMTTKTIDKEQNTDRIDVREFATGTSLDDTIAHIVATTPELEDMEESMESSVSNHRHKRNDASIFEELADQDADLIGDVDYGADITGRAVNPADYASSDSDEEREDRNSTVSDNFFGMSRELENLILENTELLATKNALNIVKDDLIAKVDELSSEHEIFREEINSLRAVKDKLQGRIKELEDDLKKAKEEMEKKTQQQQEAENEDDVPMAQRKRFTRVEMARVLMERNQYKERLMELQEAVRWTEMIRATREHPEIAQSKKKSSIWNFSKSVVISRKATFVRFLALWLWYIVPVIIHFFGNLFSSPNKPTKRPLPVAMIKYNAPTTNVQPVGDPNQKHRSKYLGDKSKAYDFLQDDLQKSLGEPIVTQPDTSERAKKEREKERKEQYKQVRAHVKKDDGRMQAYGWSLPAKFQPQLPTASAVKSTVPVPVPVYCRPLLESEQGIKIWCAAGVNLTGGRTKDGGSIVGASVFYSNPGEEEPAKPRNGDEVGKVEQELQDHENNLRRGEKEQLSSLVWICTSTTVGSSVSVIDANNPGDILETFRVSTTPILCIASVPGALESDYPVDEDILKADSYPHYPDPTPSSGAQGVGDEKREGEEAGIGGVSFVQCATGSSAEGKSGDASPVGRSPQGSRDVSPSPTNLPEAVAQSLNKDTASNHSGSTCSLSDQKSSMGSRSSLNKRASLDSIIGKRFSQGSIYSIGESSQPTVFKAKGEPVNSGAATPDLSGRTSHRLLKDPSGLVKDGINSLASGNDLQAEEVEKMGSVLPTMWLGAQSGSLYVHSSVSQWRRCLHSVKLRDSILNIVHVKGRVLVALADGTVAIFHRHPAGQWDLENYHLLDLGKPHHSIRCMTVIANKHVWCGYRNKVHVVDPQNMSIAKSFDAHPRKESQVRQLAWVGDGVWVSIRLDSTLRLYHAYTYQHLQDVDIEPYVSKMLGTGKLGFSFVRITSMLVSCNRLWIGTGNGVIISVPLSENNKQAVSMGSSMHRPGGLVRVYTDSKTDSVTPASFIPYCTMAQAQLSFHGHRDAVKFFVAVPGKKRKGLSQASYNVDRQAEEMESPTDDGSRLVLSGGEGYVDFRIVFNLRIPKARRILGDGDDDAILGGDTGEEKEEKTSLSKGERSHLIVWEVGSPE